MITSAVERDKVVELHTASGIRVTYSSPESIPDVIKKQKLNRMYEILSGAERSNSEKNENE